MARDEVFGASDPRVLFGWVEANFKELEAAPDLRRLANCLTLVNHMPDWVWHSWLKERPDRSGTFTPRPVEKKGPSSGEVQVREWIEAHCPAAILVGRLANGVKHLRTSGRDLPGTGSGMYLTAAGFGALAFNHDQLWWVLDDAGEKHVVYTRGSTNHLLSRVIDFWREFLRARPDWS